MAATDKFGQNDAFETSASDHETYSEEVVLYYDSDSFYCVKVLMGLYEKGVQFSMVPVDLLNNEQHELWFLKMNPRGEVPVLKHRNRIVTDSNQILKYIDQTFESANMLFPNTPEDKIGHFVTILSTIPVFPLTFGAAVFQTEQIKCILRYPFCEPGNRDIYRRMILSQPTELLSKSQEASHLPAGDVLAKKAQELDRILPLLQDKQLYDALLQQVGKLLDQVEKELNVNNRIGPWLCGPMFSAADIILTCLLYRLRQIGLDKKFWLDGVRPCISMYSQLTFERPSFEKATNFSKVKHKEYVYEGEENSSNDLKAAAIGLGSVIALGAAYAYKKFKR